LRYIGFEGATSPGKIIVFPSSARQKDEIPLTINDAYIRTMSKRLIDFLIYTPLVKDKVLLFPRRDIVESALYVKKKWGTLYGT